MISLDVFSSEYKFIPIGEVQQAPLPDGRQSPWRETLKYKSIIRPIGMGIRVLGIYRGTETYTPVCLVAELLWQMNKRWMIVHQWPLNIRGYYMSQREASLLNLINHHYSRLGPWRFNKYDGLILIDDIRKIVAADTQLQKRHGRTLESYPIERPKARSLEPMTAELSRTRSYYVKILNVELVTIYCEGRQFCGERAVRIAILHAFPCADMEEFEKLYTPVPLLYMSLNDSNLLNVVQISSDDQPVLVKWTRPGHGLVLLEHAICTIRNLAAVLHQHRAQGEQPPVDCPVPME